MKKLMFAAFAAAVTSGAFAAPLVYDYKASAKHMYAKEVNVRFNGQVHSVYRKYVKTASLKGYLIVDADGATSQTIIADKITNDPAFNTGAWANGTGATGVDFGRNRAFLVVMNTKAEREVRAPKLLPAVLDAKWLDDRFNVDGTGRRVAANNRLAEGYLYVGGDFGAATRTKLDTLTGGVITDRGVTLANQAMIGDYVWQSLWLFGKYNMPLIATTALGNWDAVQGAIDTGADGANLPLTNGFAAGRPFFHDAWMNGAGFGKYQIADGSLAGCCGFSFTDVATVLQSLSGNLKGGLFLCTENGTCIENGQWAKFPHIQQDWEDQFFCARITDGSGTFGADWDQTDLWQDGQLEMNTTDCISGTWSIKRTTRLAPVAITQADLNNGLGLAVPANWSEDAPGLTDLLSTIKGAAQRLDRDSLFANGRNIFNYTQRDLGTYAEVPLITPAFAAYYGFLNFK